MPATLDHDIQPAAVRETIANHLLVKGFHLTLDLHASRGARLIDAVTGREYVDFYGFYASQPIGLNHPKLRAPEFQARLIAAATTKVVNTDVYTTHYAEFVDAIANIAAPAGFDRFFFIEGGALAVENALKAAMDWKVQKNIAAGKGERGTEIIHLRQAFHGRSGYTLSLTNTDPVKIARFPKFDWPRIDNPFINFGLPEPQRTEDVAQREDAALNQLREIVAQRADDIAAFIMEPIQAEGGDHHFRTEFLRAIRKICDEHEIILIFDEVQTGGGITGKMWGCQHHDVYPDIIAFGKKFQCCGIMATDRLNEVDSVFTTPGRIASTWGGNLCDMVRATQYLRIIEEEELLARAADRGDYLQQGLGNLAEQFDCITAVRGAGLMCAFDLPDKSFRDQLRQACWDHQVATLHCGERSLRFRPVLDIEAADIDEGLQRVASAVRAVLEQHDA